MQWKLGLLSMVAGLLLLVLSKPLEGLILMLVGLSAMAFHYATLMRGQGYDPDQATINGLKGQGKQRSEVVNANLPEPGEQTPDIWEKMMK